MIRPRTLLRFASLVALAVWLGGFTFYSAAVVPILHDEFGSLGGSAVTRRATDVLNLVGLAAVGLWWADLAADRWADVRVGRLRPAALIGSTAGLAVLFVLHHLMDRRLDTVGLRGFYPWHRAYLILSTATWAANLGLLASTVAGRPDRTSAHRGAPSDADASPAERARR